MTCILRDHCMKRGEILTQANLINGACANININLNFYQIKHHLTLVQSS